MKRVERQILPDSSAVLASNDAASNLTSLTPPGRPVHGFDYTPVDLRRERCEPPDLRPRRFDQRHRPERPLQSGRACIEKYRLDPLIGNALGSGAGGAFNDATIGALPFVDVSKGLLPPFRMIGKPTTSVFSSAVGIAARMGLPQEAVLGLRQAGRFINPAADALIIGEGFFDGAIVIQCLTGLL